MPYSNYMTEFKLKNIKVYKNDIIKVSVKNITIIILYKTREKLFGRFIEKSNREQIFCIVYTFLVGEFPKNGYIYYFRWLGKLT